ncbi:hypothetical protein N656DRAFT_797027 [Canariomyces notabilis]|uniref:Uncharacterized protein n=1 Tax=Canariomyces notabilis TaxID=2074819 RepID=A0AAN6YUT1_9PEZI|nr:hypothetical protein N656DRAFT_797027 [Canariomyces arenarius]
MAFWWAKVLQRDIDSSAHPGLTTGAIAGISCGAGALFLCAAALFIVYWRRQRRYNRADNFYQSRFDDFGPSGSMGPSVTYTTDYKLDQQQNEGEARHYTYSPEKQAHPFCLPSAHGSSSAMPTHPAYIPRALIRGAPPLQSSRSGLSHTPSPPQYPSPGMASSKSQPDDAVIQAYLNATVTKPPAASPAQGKADVGRGDDKDAILPAEAHESDSPSLASGLPVQVKPQRGRQAPQAQVPAIVIPPAHTSPPPLSATSANTVATGTTFTTTIASGSTRSSPRQYIPPRLHFLPSSLFSRSDGGSGSGGGTSTRPVISGPLALPQVHHHHHRDHPGPQELSPGASSGSSRDAVAAHGQDQEGEGEEDVSPWRRTFRRSLSRTRILTLPSTIGGGGKGGLERAAGSRRDGSTSTKAKRKKDKYKESKRGSGGGGGGAGNRHYAEIEIGTGSDIW